MADYIPITDQEIEPEAPLTSLLQHKLRDNPEAVYEGSPTAPRIPYVALDTGQGQIVGPDMVIRPGGALETGYEFSTASTASDNRILLARTHQAGVSRGAWVYLGTDSLNTYYNNYFIAGSFEYTWLFVMKSKATGDILSQWYSCFHVAYGQTTYHEQPFLLFDPLLHDLFVVNLTYEQHREVKVAQIPKKGGGYFSGTTVLNTSEIDNFADRRSFLVSFYSLFSLDYTALPWLLDDFYIGIPSSEIGIFSLAKEQIPEPTDVTRIGVNPI